MWVPTHPLSPTPHPAVRTLARLLSRSGRFTSGTVIEGLKSCRGGKPVRLGLRAGRGGAGGGTHIQQGAGVHAEAVARQHALQAVQIRVHGVQVVTELGPGRSEWGR